MYLAILVVLLGLGTLLTLQGVADKRKVRLAGGIALIACTLAFFSFLSFWGEVLWFDSLGYAKRFWIEIGWQAGLGLAGGVIGLVFITLLTLYMAKSQRSIRRPAKVLAFIVGGVWGAASWQTVLKFLKSVPTEMTDPILYQDTGFYLFTLPFLDIVYQFLLFLAVLGLITSVISLLFRFQRNEVEFVSPDMWSEDPKRYRSLFLNVAVLLFVLALGRFLDRYHLMYSTLGAVSGPGWTDVHILLPGYWIVSVFLVAVGLVLLVPSLRRKIGRWSLLQRFSPRVASLATLAGAAILSGAVWIGVLSLLPSAVQWLRVEPNEITMEKPYISHNIEFTRHGFNVHNVEEREFPVKEAFNREMIGENQNTFANVRLWDWRALDAVYKQFQEIRLYYEFADVDVDRYRFGNMYRQVMVSAREMEQNNLPPQSRTFVNKRFKYTHGYGITLTNVSEFTPEGLPHLIIRDIPPKSRFDSLEVKRPEIYYGELTDSHVVVNTEEAEFDYPRGDQNEYIRYPGRGGVQLTNVFRKFLYGWKFDGTKFFLSGYPTSESRIMFHRQIKDRVAKLAPFLEFDQDPYIVLSEGRLYWIVDGYTTSSDFPYSEPFTESGALGQTLRPGEVRPGQLFVRTRGRFHGINYIRNSVKVVVDAFNGSVDMYVFDEEDPLIKVWDKVFPGLFKNKDRMPRSLRNHVRYPMDMLLIQGLVYAKYHMNNPTVFYNQEDLWIRATETYYGRVQPVEPYYIMWEPPGSSKLEYILMMPFTPKNRQVLIGWIAGMCDGENYGRFLAYNFPKEKRVLGTQQVETKIDQDSYLSGQLSLWDQRGSRVVRGNVLVMPIDETIIYVEPIYLQAETAAYPELRLVVVMHNDNLSYAETFDQALEGLFSGEAPPLPEGATPAAVLNVEELAGRAQEAFTRYLKALGNEDFQGASQALSELKQTLSRLVSRSEPTEESGTGD